MAHWLTGLSIGQWYEAGGESFEIVGIDADAEVVLVQHFDGSLEDFDFDQWLALEAAECAAPEDYSGALDLEPEDYVELAGDRAGPKPYDDPIEHHWNPDTLL